MSQIKNIAIALDQLAGTIFLRTQPDETISAWAYRTDRKRWVRAINWLFRNPEHCAESFMAELLRTQEPEEYRKSFSKGVS